MRYIPGLKGFLMTIFKERIMVLTIPIIVIAVAVVVGFTAHFITHKDDGAVEEMAEDLIEDQVEIALHLPDGSQHIDLTPGSKENDLGEIANEKIRSRSRFSPEMNE